MVCVLRHAVAVVEELATTTTMEGEGRGRWEMPVAVTAPWPALAGEPCPGRSL